MCVSFKEVIQPQVPLGLPCYDFTPVMNHTVVTVPPKVRLATSGATHSHGVTGGVYKEEGGDDVKTPSSGLSPAVSLEFPP